MKLNRIELPKPDRPHGHSRKQVLAICRKHKIHHKTFWKAFGVNTCAVDKDGLINYYTCDIERTLAVILKYRRVSSLEWD